MKSVRRNSNRKNEPDREPPADERRTGYYGEYIFESVPKAGGK